MGSGQLPTWTVYITAHTLINAVYIQQISVEIIMQKMQSENIEHHQ